MIDIKSLTINDVIRVGTEEEYTMLCKMLDEAGFIWSSGEKFFPCNQTYSGVRNKYINPVEGMFGIENYSRTIFTKYSLADFLPSSSSSNSFTTLFPFNLTS